MPGPPRLACVIRALNSCSRAPPQARIPDPAAARSLTSAQQQMSRMRTAAVTTLLLVPIGAGAFPLKAPATRTSARLFDQVRTLVETRYVDTLKDGAIFEKAARGMVRELNDPYSELLTPKESDTFNRSTNGRYGGTGMLLEQQPGAPVSVQRVFPHTPADEAGVREGDRIIAVDGVSTLGWEIDKVSEKLRGNPGSKGAVPYARPGVTEPIKLKFTRAVVHVPAVAYTGLFDQQ